MAVGLGADFPGLVDAEGVVVLAAPHPCGVKPSPKLDAPHCRDAKHHPADLIFHSVEDGGAQASGQAGDTALHHTADGIPFPTDLFDEGGHPAGGLLGQGGDLPLRSGLERLAVGPHRVKGDVLHPTH